MLTFALYAEALSGCVLSGLFVPSSIWLVFEVGML